MKIRVLQLWDGFEARLAGTGAIAQGDRVDAAIGQLVTCYPNRFGVTDIAIQPRLPLEVAESENQVA